ncbi:hypothetical protein P7K49_000581 [Saguinus oedipus]|uniref:Uncharacterized protein n=1 Tax=Saguinus oedipus TaxID=9490 RepID=A0ABQ9WC09_SAGOE|nr:hypothetical protein P7K49_000581 [Saguinus oedipus]
MQKPAPLCAAYWRYVENPVYRNLCTGAVQHLARETFWVQESGVRTMFPEKEQKSSRQKVGSICCSIGAVPGKGSSLVQAGKVLEDLKEDEYVWNAAPKKGSLGKEAGRMRRP